jgi:hypothetical protein
MVFDYTKADSQAVRVEPVRPAEFPFDDYEQYEAARLERCRSFWGAKEGVLVYRRMRVGECFSAGCSAAGHSLQLQMGALKAGMEYAGDVPNFLEPWYGIGILASAFGAEYEWHPGQAPAVRPRFQSVREALETPFQPVAETVCGRHTLEMIECFLNETSGRLPISLTDTQSPLNTACMLVDTSNFLLDCIDDPDSVRAFLGRLADLQVEFVRRQRTLIGAPLVWPGHGFASSRVFCGLGQSDDNLLMMSNDMYRDLAVPSLCAGGAPFGGPVFHSCGNWSDKLPVIMKLPGLRMVDAAFGEFTDPNPNPVEAFPEVMAGTGIVLNARIVGEPDQVIDSVRRLWVPGMKLIVVSYCETPREQAEVYNRVQAICAS